MRGNNQDRKRDFGGGNSSGFKSNFGFNERRSFGPREMHKATCSECHAECEVPFVPTEGKPVYCRECYKKHRTF